MSAAAGPRSFALKCPSVGPSAPRGRRSRRLPVLRLESRLAAIPRAEAPEEPAAVRGLCLRQTVYTDTTGTGLELFRRDLQADDWIFSGEPAVVCGLQDAHPDAHSAADLTDPPHWADRSDAGRGRARNTKTEPQRLVFPPICLRPHRDGHEPLNSGRGGLLRSSQSASG